MESSLRILYLVSFLTVFVNFSHCDSPEQGIFEVNLDEVNSYGGVSKNLAEETEIQIHVKDCKGETEFLIEWIVRYTECHQLEPDSSDNVTRTIFANQSSLMTMFQDEEYIAVQRSKSNEPESCSKSSQLLNEAGPDSFTCCTTYSTRHCDYCGLPIIEKPTEKPPAATTKPNDKAAGDGKQIKRRAAVKRDVTAVAGHTNVAPISTAKPDATTTQAANTTKGKYTVTKTNKRAGRYWVLVHLKTEQKGEVTKTEQKGEVTQTEQKVEVTLTIDLKSPSGYLSAYQAPLLVFYGVMCGVYSLLTFVWLILCAFQWRDLLRIQFWIGGVMLLGLLEKAVFYAEYENVNKNGISVPGAIIMAELISCSKRSLARMLVVIVSLGYGITRPRLGKDLHWVLGVGMLYFILSSVEACLRVKGTDQNDMIAILPLSVLDAIICWWVFKSLVDTTRTLRLRRNMVKLWLYRHFTNTLIFCVLAAFIFLLWSFKVYRWTTCMKKWNELWLDDAYWHVLFCIILIVIVILFRPTANNQRYAYSPLTDREGDDESQEPMLNDAFEGMKMRNVMTNRNESQISNKTDDDLKWVEDNIPAAVADAALGAFDDSEEELVTNLERSKME